MQMVRYLSTEEWEEWENVVVVVVLVEEKFMLSLTNVLHTSKLKSDHNNTKICT